MKIALIGYGKMGKAIEQIALDRGHTTGLKITNQNAGFTPADLHGHDVAIEFSVPTSAANNIRTCLDAGVPVVVGTTGWYDEFEAITQAVETQQGALFHATNFSIGVNLFFEINKRLAALMNPQADYDVRMKEIHHIHKLDSPSGTGITLANQVIDQLDRKSNWSETETGAETLHITSERTGEVPGTHIMTWESEIDTLEISHEAKGRTGFALGAVHAAEWIVGRQGVFTMNDLLNLS